MRRSKTNDGMRAVLAAAAAVLAIACVGAGCGVKNSEGGITLTGATFSVRADSSIARQVPPQVRSGGILTVASDATYPPDEFIASDGTTVIGLDADLAKALAEAMGLKAKIQNVPFDSIIPGLAAGKYDLGMSSFTDTAQRERVVDFVTYATAGESFFVNASGGPRISSLDDLSGHTVGAEKGTNEASDAMAESARCNNAGRLPVGVMVFPDENGVNLALASGRVEVGFADTPVAAYAVKQSSGKFKLVGTSLANAPYGIAIPRGSGLQQPVLAAMKALMANGTYKKILEYWGLQADAIGKPTINAATSGRKES